jgi:TIR domain
VEAVLTMAHDVFISHSSVDKPAADAACAALEARGIRCWIAPRDINPGRDWAASIMQAIEGTRILLLVLSRSAKESIQVRREVAQAANSGKQLLTLRIEDVLPEAELKFYLDSPHWLDAITKPFEAHLKRLADACAILLAPLDTDHDSATSDAARPQLAGGKPDVAWWRRHRQPVKVALVAAVVGVLAAVAGLTGHLLRPSAAHAPPPSPASAPPGPSFAAPAPALNPAGGSDPRAQIVQLTGSWSDQGFVNAIVDRDTRIVALYLQSGMKATTLSQGASAILFGFQGVPQNGDPVALVTTFQTNGFKVDDELEDSYLMAKLGQNPVPFNTPLAPKGYAGGAGGKFVGSLLFWIVQRATWNGPNDQDIQVINYLISQGADCNVPLSFLKSISYMASDSPYQKLLPMMQSCAK